MQFRGQLLEFLQDAAQRTGAGLRKVRQFRFLSAFSRLQPAFAQQALHALDRVALGVEQITYTPEQRDILRPVVAPPAAALQRLELWKLRLPEPEDMLRDMQILRDL